MYKIIFFTKQQKKEWIDPNLFDVYMKEMHITFEHELLRNKTEEDGNVDDDVFFFEKCEIT